MPKQTYFEKREAPVFFEIQPKLRPLPHFHKEIEIVYIIEGSCEAVCDYNRFKIKSGDLFIAFPNQVHFYEESVHGRYLVIIVSSEVFFDLDKIMYNNIPKVSVINNLTQETAQRLINAFNAQGGYKNLWAVGELSVALAEILPQLQFKNNEENKNSAIYEIINYCTQNFSDPEITLESISEEIHISKNHISYLMNNKLRISFKEYLNSVRVKKACSLLLETNKKIAEISEECGFGSIRTFNRVFSQQKKITPIEYRKKVYNISLPVYVEKTLEIFKKAGAEAFLVGGGVRDSLLNKEVYDFDITTPLTPDKVISLFAEYKVIPTGVKHGTVTLIMDNKPIEITTYRVESGYKDNRHPDSVRFSANLKEDLARRDFTINTICYSPYFGIYDPFSGQADLKKKVLRAVGEPEVRFKEDALRILRAIRFAAVLGFNIEENTEKAIFKLGHLLKNVSKERIFSELKKLILGDYFASALNKYFAVLAKGVQAEIMQKDKVDFTPLKGAEKDIYLRLAGIIYLTGGDDAYAKSLLKALKSDNQTIKNVTDILSQAQHKIPCGKRDLKLVLNRIDEAAARRYISFLFLTKKITEYEEKNLLGILKEIINCNECYKLSGLNVKGEDILKLGFEPKEVGKILNKLLNKVIEDNSLNEKNTLLDFAKNM